MPRYLFPPHVTHAYPCLQDSLSVTWCSDHTTQQIQDIARKEEAADITVVPAADLDSKPYRLRRCRVDLPAISSSSPATSSSSPTTSSSPMVITID